jgi:predicted NBD/HSP70 family sugar kinase
VPFRINPDGGYAFGLKVGRHSAELVLINALMEVVAVTEKDYTFPHYPQPEQLFNFVQRESAQMLASVGARVAERHCGLGIALPFGLWNWPVEMGVAQGALDDWRDLDLAADWSERLGWPVMVVNDATCACAAEVALHPADTPRSALHIFVGWFIGGGLILNGKVYEGEHGNAGAIGSMLVTGGDGRPQQLLRLASLNLLERELIASGGRHQQLWDEGQHWQGFNIPLENWLDQAAPSIAQAVAQAAAVIDFDCAIIDGAMPVAVRARLVEQIRQAYRRLDSRGLTPPEIRTGRVGRNARGIGAASLLLLDAFAVELNDLPELTD